MEGVVEPLTATSEEKASPARDTQQQHHMKRPGLPYASSEVPGDLADTRACCCGLVEATTGSISGGAGGRCLEASGGGLVVEPPGERGVTAHSCTRSEDEQEWTMVRKGSTRAHSAPLCGREGPAGPGGTVMLVEECIHVAGGRPSISPPSRNNEGRLTSTLSGNRFELLDESTSSAQGSGEEERVKLETESPGGGSLSSPSGRCFTKGPELSQLPGVAGHNAESSGWLEAVKGDATPASAEEAAGQHGGTRSLSAVLLPAISSCASWLLVERRHGSSVLVSTARHLWVRPR